MKKRKYQYFLKVAAIKSNAFKNARSSVFGVPRVKEALEQMLNGLDSWLATPGRVITLAGVKKNSDKQEEGYLVAEYDEAGNALRVDELDSEGNLFRAVSFKAANIRYIDDRYDRLTLTVIFKFSLF